MTIDNPYVGPRPFEPNETLYGREKEVRQLLDLLIADRIVLLHSPSGAGKTSLIQAALIPELKNKDFRVLPVMRISLALPPDEKPPVTANRYIFSLLFAMERMFPEKQQIPLSELAGMKLDDYLNRRTQANEEPLYEVLIFDQFEEILTSDPTDQEVKQEFFTQVGTALQNRRRWALFAMREEFLGQLAPYRNRIPTRLSSTFRLELLKEPAALQAIQQPARQAGVKFTDDAATKLVKELREIQIPGSGEKPERQEGPYIEPVQLQVVCHSLWEKWTIEDPHDEDIGLDDVEDYGDVNNALAEYYAEKVKAVAKETGVEEKTIRQWFDDHLITRQGIRSHIQKGLNTSEGLNNKVIEELVDAHLIREEKQQHRGAIWLELAHDRLIEPVCKSNDQWFKDNLSILQRQAAVWKREGRPDSLLLHDKELKAAEKWAREHKGELTKIEENFLEKCYKQQKAHQSRKWAISATVAVILISIASSLVTIYYLKAQQEKRLATSRELAAIAVDKLDADPELSVLLARHAIAELKAPGEGTPPLTTIVNPVLTVLNLVETTAVSSVLRFLNLVDENVPKEVQDALRRAVEQISRIEQQPVPAHKDIVQSIAFSPDGTHLTTASRDGTARMWDLSSGEKPASSISNEIQPGTGAAAFSLDGVHLAFESRDGTRDESRDGTIKIWNANSRKINTLSAHNEDVSTIALNLDGTRLATASRSSQEGKWNIKVWNIGSNDSQSLFFDHPVSRMTFNRNGTRLAIASYDGTGAIWDIGSDNVPQLLPGGHSDAILSIAFSSDGTHLATAGRDETAKIWNVSSDAYYGSSELLLTLYGHSGAIADIIFNQDGTRLATGSWDGTVKIWDAKSGRELLTLVGHGKPITAVTFNPDGEHLATGSWDGRVKVWNGIIHHTASVGTVAFSPPDGKYLASGSADKTVKVWKVSPDRNMLSELLFTLEHGSAISIVAYSPDGSRLATASRDGKIKIWDAKSGKELELPIEHSFAVNSVAFSPDGKHLATASWDRTAKIWDTATGENVHTLNLDHGVLGVAFSADGKYLATASFDRDRTVAVWKITTNQTPKKPLWKKSNQEIQNQDQDELPGHTGFVFDIAFSPDGKYLATTGLNGTVRIWDPMSGKPLHSLGGFSNLAVRLTFSRNGNYLAAASLDGTARVWKTNNFDEWQIFTHTAAVNDIAFSPDERHLATASSDHQIHLSPLDLEELIELASKRITRPLTKGECDQYLHKAECPTL